MIDYRAGIQHFASCDLHMHGLLQKFVSDNGMTFRVPVAAAELEYFPSLVRIVVGQQINTRVAVTIYERLTDRWSLEPSVLRKVTAHDLGTIGISRQKAKCIIELACNWSNLKVEEFRHMSDKNITHRLVAHHGVGVWTAEMFLLFTLARPNVFSMTDYVLRQQLFRHYPCAETDHQYRAKVLASWSPYRSLAALVLWADIADQA